MKNARSVAIVLPAYNEGEVIGAVLRNIPKTVNINGTGYSVKIIVVNDGSKDSTEQEVKKNKHVYLINHILNSGAGAATRTGLHFAYDQGYDYVVTMDSDGQHAIEDVKKLIQVISEGDADFVIGSRLINSVGMPWYRVIGNKGLSLFTFLMFGVFVTDSQSGLKALNRKAVSQINFHSNNFAFCSEMLWHAKKAKLIIKEIPIKAIYSEYSLAKGQSNTDVIHIVRQMIKQRILGVFDG